MEYLKRTQRPPGAEKGMDLAGKALTQKSDRPRKTWGSLEMSLQSVRGLCQYPKCVRRDGHPGDCWPV